MEVPDGLCRTVTAWFGDDGRRWCDAAPAVVERLIDTWELRPGVLLHGATHALVLACVRADGSPAVLKLPFVDNENRTEAEALRLYDGDGAARLLDHDPACGALLLERLMPGTPLLDLPDRARALDIACGLLRRLRRRPRRSIAFPGCETSQRLGRRTSRRSGRRRSCKPPRAPAISARGAARKSSSTATLISATCSRPAASPGC
jgi:hypothetical protein